jgi:hypothetical protein
MLAYPRDDCPLGWRNVLRPSEPPGGLPAYRLLTGRDDETFCRRVSGALAMGYALYGSPAATFNGDEVIVAQAVVWGGAAKERSDAGRER